VTTPRVPIVAKRFQVIGGLPWAQSFRFKRPILNEAGQKIGEEIEDVSAYTGWVADWRPEARSAREVPLVVDSSLAAEGIVTVSADAEGTEDMDGAGVFDVLAELSGVPRGFVRAKTSWERVVTRDD